MEFPKLLKKIASGFSWGGGGGGGSIKSNVQFPGVIKKKSYGTSRGGLSFRS